MPLPDLDESFRYLRADGDQPRAAGVHTRCQLPVVMRQGDVAGGAAGEAEEDQDQRPVRMQPVESDFSVGNVDQRRGADRIADLYPAPGAQFGHQPLALLAIDPQRLGRPALGPLCFEGAELFREGSHDHDLRIFEDHGSVNIPQQVNRIEFSI